MKNIITVSDFIFPNKKDLFDDYFLHLMNPSESLAHNLVYSSDDKDLCLSQIIKFFLESADINDSYIICSEMDDICNTVESDRLIYGNKLSSFKDFSKVSFAVLPFWPSGKCVKEINKMIDNCPPLFIVLF